MGMHCQMQHMRPLRRTGEVDIIKLWNLLTVAGCKQSTEESSEGLGSLFNNLTQNIKARSPP